MVAVRQNSGKGKAGKSLSKISLWALFWVAFLILVCGLFLANREKIRKTLEDNRPAGPSLNRPPAEKPVPPLPPPPEAPVPPPAQPAAPPEPPPVEAPPVVSAPEAPPPVPETPPPRQNPAPPENTRERSLYFIQIDGGGGITRTKVARRLPASDSPMLDVLQALLQGPGAEEQRRGIRSLIPPGSRVLSARVQGNTAYISFNDDFQYNEYGVEGYAAQLRQIIWTVTEFSNVQSVQFLIEGRRYDYLGESIWIGSPLDRNSPLGG